MTEEADVKGRKQKSKQANKVQRLVPWPNPPKRRQGLQTRSKSKQTSIKQSAGKLSHMAQMKLAERTWNSIYSEEQMREWGAGEQVSGEEEEEEEEEEHVRWSHSQVGVAQQAFFHCRHLGMSHSRKNTGANDKMNDGWIPFRCSSFESWYFVHTVPSSWDTWSEQSHCLCCG